MPFYRKRVTYDEIAPVMQKYREYLRANAVTLREQTTNEMEAFLVTPSLFQEIIKGPHSNVHALMITAKYMVVIPYDNTIGYAFYLSETAEGSTPTVAPDYFRLPKLSYLITLTPHDFFTFLKLVATSKRTSSGDAMSLNFPAAGIRDLFHTSLGQFFVKLRTNYRLNPDYADRKWTAKSDVIAIADLPPDRDAQLMAMQYLTATQNIDLMYFPLETALDLDLDWEQMNNDYAIPPSFAGTQSLISERYKS